jgi:hypothetical protein
MKIENIEYYKYVENLRKRVECKMYEEGKYLQSLLDEYKAREILQERMANYADIIEYINKEKLK